MNELQDTPGLSLGSFNFDLKGPPKRFQPCFSARSAAIVFSVLMENPAFSSLEPAYQLHFYLCFKSHCLRPCFAEQRVRDTLCEVADDLCQRESYHLLEAQTSPDHFRLLISLKPEQPVSRAVKMLKGNLSRTLGRRFGGTERWLARGYFARTSGKVDLETVRSYVRNQVSHHGYRGKWTEALEYRNALFKSPAFEFSHSVSLLDYHMVLVTKRRAAVFDETIAPGLFRYVVAVGGKRGFAIERMSILPDHCHLLFEAVPSRSINEIALSLMNNTVHWMGKYYWGVLKQADAWELWEPSYYVGTLGEYTTAQVKRFLGL
jgi:putative transposase